MACRIENGIATVGRDTELAVILHIGSRLDSWIQPSSYNMGAETGQIK